LGLAVLPREHLRVLGGLSIGCSQFAVVRTIGLPLDDGEGYALVRVLGSEIDLTSVVRLVRFEVPCVYFSCVDDTGPPPTFVVHYCPQYPAGIAVCIMDFSYLNKVEQRESR